MRVGAGRYTAIWGAPTQGWGDCDLGFEGGRVCYTLKSNVWQLVL